MLHYVRTLLTVALLFALESGGTALRAAEKEPDPRSASRVVLELPPGPGNPRNSEGAFLSLKDGRILFVYSRFVGASSGDAAKARLAARHSADDGETWSGDALIVTPEEDEVMNVMSSGIVKMSSRVRESWRTCPLT